jgi:hypothetical protein
METKTFYETYKETLKSYQSKKYNEDEVFRAKRIKDTIANSNKRYATDPEYVAYRSIQNKKYNEKRKLLEQQKQMAVS